MSINVRHGLACYNVCVGIIVSVCVLDASEYKCEIWPGVL